MAKKQFLLQQLALLLKEFILSEDAEFTSIQGNSGQASNRKGSELAIERARKFMLDEGMINDRQVFMHDTSELWVEKNMNEIHFP